MSASPPSLRLLSPGESLGSLPDWRWRRLGVVTLLGASCVETRLGGSVQWFSGACHWSELIFMGAMYAAAGESKTMAFLGPTESRYSLAVSS